MFDLDAQERANKSALLLVHQRYASELHPFVKDSKVRLAYVEGQLEEIITSVATETGADSVWVSERFQQFIAETTGVPPAKFEEGDPLEGSDVKDSDVQDMGTVDGAGLEEALDPDALEHQDLGDSSGTKGETDSGRPTSNLKDLRDEDVQREFVQSITAGQSQGCVRCGKTLNAVFAKHTPVCPTCTAELKKLAGPGFGESYEDSNPQSLDYINDRTNVDQDLQYNCTICGEQGTRDDIYSHVQKFHPDAVAGKQQEMMGQPTPPQGMPAAAKVADVPDADNPERAEVQPLPETPADQFDDIIQDLANRAAARQFSAPSETEVHQIASQLGLDEQQVRNSLISTAMFGDHAATNGQLGEQAGPPEGYEEVSLQGMGGRVDSHEALVPVDLVVNKVADAMNMEPNLVYQQVRDKYGDDLPDKYHASVSGETHYYLPTEMAGNQQQADPTQQPGYDPNVGPTAPPAPEPAQVG
jgi:hypothetical protein